MSEFQKWTTVIKGQSGSHRFFSDGENKRLCVTLYASLTECLIGHGQSWVHHPVSQCCASFLCATSRGNLKGGKKIREKNTKSPKVFYIFKESFWIWYGHNITSVHWEPALLIYGVGTMSTWRIIFLHLSVSIFDAMLLPKDLWPFLDVYSISTSEWPANWSRKGGDGRSFWNSLLSVPF